MRFFLAIALLLVASPANAERIALDEAEKQQAAMEYAQAVETVQALVERGANSLADLKRAYVVAATSLASLGLSNDSKRYFTRLLALDPGFSLGADVSPKVHAPLADAKADWGKRPSLTAVHPHIGQARVDQPLTLKLKVVADPLKMVRGAAVSYQLPGKESPSTLGTGGDDSERVLAIPLPALDVKPGKMTYSLQLVDAHQNILWQEGPLELEILGASEAAAPIVAATPWYKRWWVWAIAGVVVAGATTAAVVATSRPDQSDIAMGWEVRP